MKPNFSGTFNSTEVENRERVRRLLREAQQGPWQPLIDASELILHQYQEAMNDTESGLLVLPPSLREQRRQELRRQQQPDPQEPQPLPPHRVRRRRKLRALQAEFRPRSG